MATSTKTVRVELTGDPSSLDRSLTVVSEKSAATASKMEGHASRIGGAFKGLDNLLGGFGIPFTGAIGTIGDKFDDLSIRGETAFKKISAAGGAAVLGLTAAAVGIGIESVHLADSFEKAHANLETAVKNSGGSMKQLNPILDDQESKFAKLGFTATQYEGALAAGTLATGNSKTALGLMSHAADLAAFSHTTLEKATIALAKASEGNLRPLKQLGIDLPIQAANAVQVAKAQDKLTAAQEKQQAALDRLNNTSGKDAVKAYAAYLGATDAVAKAQDDLTKKQQAGSEILDAVNKKTEGASAKAAETFQGKVKALEAELENMGIKIGQFLIPIIEDLVTAISDVINWFEKHKAAAIALAGVITTVLGAAISVFVYDKVAAFVSGIQRMLTGLGLLKAQAAETAATVEASGATMAESTTAASATAGAEGAVIGAEGAGAGAAGGIAAAGAEAEGASAGFTALINPVTLVAAALLGGAYAAGYFKDGLEQTGITTDMVASGSTKRLSEAMQLLKHELHDTAFAGSEYTSAASSMSNADREHATNVEFTRKMHASFNDVLKESPQYAQQFIDAVGRSGVSTAWYSQKLEEHVVAAEKAKVAQERFALQMEIVDARARGDAGAVYGLTLQLNALPDNKDIYLATHGIDDAIYQVGVLQQQLGYLTSRDWAVAVNIMGDTSGMVVNSDRNVKRDIVPISWN